jgi:hypothetical protein
MGPFQCFRDGSGWLMAENCVRVLSDNRKAHPNETPKWQKDTRGQLCGDGAVRVLSPLTGGLFGEGGWFVFVFR